MIFKKLFQTFVLLSLADFLGRSTSMYRCKNAENYFILANTLPPDITSPISVLPRDQQTAPQKLSYGFLFQFYLDQVVNVQNGTRGVKDIDDIDNSSSHSHKMYLVSDYFVLLLLSFLLFK